MSQTMTMKDWTNERKWKLIEWSQWRPMTDEDWWKTDRPTGQTNPDGEVDQTNEAQPSRQLMTNWRTMTKKIVTSDPDEWRPMTQTQTKPTRTGQLKKTDSQVWRLINPASNWTNPAGQWQTESQTVANYWMTDRLATNDNETNWRLTIEGQLNPVKPTDKRTKADETQPDWIIDEWWPDEDGW